MAKVPCPRCLGKGTVDIESVTFGDCVRQRREALLLTQERLAEKVGLSRAQVANIESGRVDTTMSKLAKFAEALGCSQKDLLP